MKIKSINELISARLQWFARAYCQSTQQTQQEALKKFKCWSDERNLSQLTDINLSALESYQRWLYHQTHGRQGKKLSVVYQHKLLQVVKSCFYWASEQQIIHHNPAMGLKLPRLPRRLAKNVLTQAEIEQVLLGPTLKTADSLRDRALLEVLYACALRRGELLRLNQQDIDSDYRLLHIRQSKGAKDRIIPISCRALQWVKRYQQEARIILQKTDKIALFLGQRGRRLGKDMCKDKVEAYIEQAVPDKSGGCHLIRHSVATLLLNQGCDIRVIQEFLGHKDLKTTQHYLHVNMTQLKKMYQQYHPAG